MPLKNIDLFFEENPNPMWIYEKDSLNILEFNEAALSLYGYSQEEMCSLTIKDLRPEEEIPRLLESQKRDIKSFDDAGIWTHQTKNGAIIYVHIMSHPVKVDGQKCELIVAKNVTSQIKTEEKLRANQHILDSIIRKLPGTFFIFDESGDMIRWNDYTESITEYSTEEISSMKALDFFHEDIQPSIEAAVQTVLEEGKVEIETKIQSKSGTQTPLLVKASKVHIQGALRIMGIGIDISSLKEAENSLRAANIRLKTAQEIAKLGYWIHDIPKNKSNWSEGVYDIFEVDPETFTPNFESFLSLVHPEDEIIFLKNIKDVFSTQEIIDTEHRIITPGNEVKWILERIILHKDEQGAPKMLEGIAQDITEKKEKEREKEVLLTEIHHRVKNNLAVIPGLMHLKAMETDNKEIESALTDSQSRINSIALTHEILYSQESFSHIKYGENIRKLVGRVTEIFNADINVVYDLKPVKLNINQALPCSLIVNEIITNTIKHAFEGVDDPSIEIQLYEYDGMVHLEITDNGCGLPEGLDVNDPDTLGLKLIHNLTNQLEGQLKIISKNGSKFALTFEKSELKGVGSALTEHDYA